MKRNFPYIFLVLIMVLTTSLLTAAAPLPTTTFTLLQPQLEEPLPIIPLTINVGDVYTVIVKVDSDQQFISAMALPSFQFPGKGVVAVQGGDHAGRDTFARLEVTFKAKGPTTMMPDGVAPVHVVVGVRYGGGYVAVQEYVFHVTVP